MNGEFINLDTAKKIQEDKNMDKDLLKIIQNYGTRNQLKKLSEELYEFQESVFEYIAQKEACENIGCSRIHVDKCIEHMTEEMADCFVLLMQFKEYYHIDGNEIMKIMREKIDRQLGRIENESKSN